MYVEYNRPIVLPPEPVLIQRPQREEAVEPEPEPAPEPEAEPEEQPRIYDVGKILVVPERKTYNDGDLILRIPKLDLETPVYDGVDEDTLKKGVGLFDYAMMPGPIGQNSNVSLAGHRDIHGNIFYYIDTLGEGDEIFLEYQGKQYTYVFEEQMITDPTDWTAIQVREYSCITLQSCTPINVASHRIFVVGRLVDVSPLPGADAEAGDAANSVNDEQSGQEGDGPLFYDPGMLPPPASESIET